MDTHPSYINPDGRYVEYEDLASHIGIAVRIIEDDEKLKREFEESGIKLATDFLVYKKGFVQVTDDVGNGYYFRKLVFSASKLSPVQKSMVMGLIDDGFTYENVDATTKDNITQFHDFDL